MRIRATAPLALALFAGALLSPAAAQSISTAAPNNGSGGVFLDLTPAAAALQVDSFATYFSSAAGTPVQVEVWTRPGSYVGFSNSSAGWTLTQTVTGISSGTATLSAPVVLTTPIVLPTGGPTGIYLHAITAGGGIRYTGTGALPPQTTWSNADVTLFSDVARTGAVSFAGTAFNPRTFAGTINYSPSNPNATGACCLGDGTCQVLTQSNCTAQGGVFAGQNVTCASANCPQPGACCFANNTCTTALPAACLAQGGVFRGAGSSCGSVNCAPGNNVVALDIRATTNRVLRFPVNYPAQTVVSTTAFEGFAMDFEGTATTLYGISNPANQLGTLDPATGTFTAIATISGDGAGETNWSGLSFDPSTNTMYASASAGAGLNNLYTINLATGATSLVAPMSDPAALFIDIAFSATGDLYTHDIVADTLVSVNKQTGQTTVIGPTGLNANFAQGMDFDWATNTLYGTVYVGTGVGSFVSFNLATGAATVLADTTAWNAEMEMAVQSAAGSTCYANCDHSTNVPFLNVLDFNCFANAFASGQSYANCDNSTSPPVLNVLDFNCFANAFSTGCSAP
jgi:hypothetical protein